jgi:glutathione S-transferase
MLTFWGFPLSFNARKVHWMLEELGVPYKYELVNLIAGEHMTPAFRAITPLQRVPVLDDDGMRLLESNAIVQYLAERYGGGRFMPATVEGRARVAMWIQLNANHIRPAIQAPWRMKWVSPLIREPHDPTQLPGLIEAARPWLDASEALLTGDWLVGDAFSVADVCLAPVIECAPQIGLALDPYPKLAAWFGRIRGREAFVKTAPPPLPG